MRRKLTNADDNAREDNVIDLASTLKEAWDESKTYICSECGSDLVHDNTYRFRNPFGGEGYYCANINKCSLFGNIFDISLHKLKVKPRPVKGAISNLKDASQEVMIDFIAEDKGLGLERDTYERYDPEPGEDERMRMQGWHIIDSRIELTDSSGINRTIVRRKH